MIQLLFIMFQDGRKITSSLKKEDARERLESKAISFDVLFG